MFQETRESLTQKKHTTVMTHRPLPEIPLLCLPLRDGAAETSDTCDAEPPNSSSYDQRPPDNDERHCSHRYEVMPHHNDLQLLNSSDDLQPPDMSEIRVVLLGNSQSERTAVVNFILEVPVFSPEEEPDYQPVRGLLRDKEVILINTPDLLLPNISEDDLREHAENCVRLTAPGPHVFLLVLQPETFTEDHKQRLCKVLKLFGKRVFDHSLVLLSASKERGSSFMEELGLHRPLKDLIKMCSYRYLWRKNLEPQELFTRLVQIFKENNGECVRYKAHS
ncbi:GTPase IMAP family member 5-like [Simochromis diagramma]|uniref:GTPase IMAP family member 5-like n=1 Tax=Simochromis diagramma TaxID=43689 RepID=UPI001A7ECA4A|nr:GTPase IMAP family member 5-like [Simochromis diagramma]